MAQYRGTACGGGGLASRLGHKTTGMTTECNGWNVGVRCYAYYDEETGQDMIKVIKTSGSGYGGVYEHITTVTSDPKEM